MRRWVAARALALALALSVTPWVADAQDAAKATSRAGEAAEAARRAIDAEAPNEDVEKVGGDQAAAAIKQGSLPVGSAQSVDKLSPKDAAERAKKDPKAFEAAAASAAARQFEAQGEEAAKAVGNATTEKELGPIAGRANVKRAVAAGPLSEAKAVEPLGGLSPKDAQALATKDPEAFKAGAAATAENAARDEGAKAEARIDQESPAAEVTALAGGPAQLAKVPPPPTEALPGGSDPAKAESSGRAEAAADAAVAQAERALDAEISPAQLGPITGGMDTRQLANEVNQTPSPESTQSNSKAADAAKSGGASPAPAENAAPAHHEQAAENAESKLDAAAEAARKAAENEVPDTQLTELAGGDMSKVHAQPLDQPTPQERQAAQAAWAGPVPGAEEAAAAARAEAAAKAEAAAAAAATAKAEAEAAAAAKKAEADAAATAKAEAAATAAATAKAEAEAAAAAKAATPTPAPDASAAAATPTPAPDASAAAATPTPAPDASAAAATPTPTPDANAATPAPTPDASAQPAASGDAKPDPAAISTSLFEAKQSLAESLTAAQASDNEAVKNAAGTITQAAEAADSLGNLVKDTPPDAAAEQQQKVKDAVAKLKETFEKANGQTASLLDEQKPGVEAALAKVKAALDGADAYAAKLGAAPAPAAQPKSDPAAFATALAEAKQALTEAVAPAQASDQEAVKTAAGVVASAGDAAESLGNVVKDTPADAGAEPQQKLKDELAKAKDALEKATAQAGSLPDDQKTGVEAALAKVKAAVEGAEGYSAKLASAVAEKKPAADAPPANAEGAKPAGAGGPPAPTALVASLEKQESTLADVVTSLKSMSAELEDKAQKKAGKRIAALLKKLARPTKALRKALAAVEGDVTKKALKKIAAALKKALAAHEAAVEALTESGLEAKDAAKGALDGLKPQFDEASAYVTAAEKKLGD